MVLNLKEIIQVLQKGEIIAYPTETFYGLGVDALNEKAIERLYEIKGRGANQPTLILVSDLEMLKNLVVEIPPLARKLITKYWPGALTLVLQASAKIPLLLTGGTETIGLRISSHPIAQMIVKAYKRPITSTSANPLREKAPLTLSQVKSFFGKRVSLYIEGGELASSRGSTIVNLAEKEARIIRQGDTLLSEEDLTL